MIKINLLTARGVRKGAAAKRFLNVFLIVLVVVLGGLGYSWWSQTAQLAGLEGEIRQLRVRLTPLQKQMAEVNKFQQRIKELEQKTKTIDELKARQTGPVLMLDALSRSLPEQLWLYNLSEGPQTLEIEGYALSNADIAIFMKNIENSGAFSAADLITAQQTEYEGVKLMRFRVDARKLLPKAEKAS